MRKLAYTFLIAAILTSISSPVVADGRASVRPSRTAAIIAAHKADAAVTTRHVFVVEMNGSDYVASIANVEESGVFNFDGLFHMAVYTPNGNTMVSVVLAGSDVSCRIYDSNGHLLTRQAGTTTAGCTILP